ncbi:MAG: alpha/beta fold hydrolase, partial [Weeksellaceae bacterium]
LQQSTYPVQIVLGEFDAAVDAEAFQKIIPGKDNIQVDVLPVGHMGHLEAPDESLKIIQEFLKK